MVTSDDIDQFDKVIATFQPMRADDLQNGAAEWIGWRGEWRVMYEIDREPYVGQWAMMPGPLGAPGERPSFSWAPFCDLADVEPYT